MFELLTKKIVVLGSTGSIGINTLEVIRENSDYFEIVGLAAKDNWKKLIKQIEEFKPKVVALYNVEAAEKLKETLKETSLQTKVKVLAGISGLLELACLDEADTIVSALVGAVGLRPVIQSIRARKKICLANKEPLVIAGKIIINESQNYNVPIIPIDSEHSAIFQCLENKDKRNVKRIILTASGGPFRLFSKEKLESVTPLEALKHPNWNMGAKITIDSATLMNKGLEVIEAQWLFNIPISQIEVIVHPQSIIHALVEFVDGSMLAQLSIPDMKLPIQYALSFPKRYPSCCKSLDLLEIAELTFEKPNLELFPCLSIAYKAAEIGGNIPCIMNAANEVAVELFLKNKIKFTDIPKLIQKTIDNLTFIANPTLEQLEEFDKSARLKTLEFASKIYYNN